MDSRNFTADFRSFLFSDNNLIRRDTGLVLATNFPNYLLNLTIPIRNPTFRRSFVNRTWPGQGIYVATPVWIFSAQGPNWRLNVNNISSNDSALFSMKPGIVGRTAGSGLLVQERVSVSISRRYWMAGSRYTGGLSCYWRVNRFLRRRNSSNSGTVKSTSPWPGL